MRGHTIQQNHHSQAQHSVPHSIQPQWDNQWMENLAFHWFKKNLLKSFLKFTYTVVKVVKINVDRWPSAMIQRFHSLRFLSWLPLVRTSEGVVGVGREMVHSSLWLLVESEDWELVSLSVDGRRWGLSSTAKNKHFLPYQGQWTVCELPHRYHPKGFCTSIQSSWYILLQKMLWWTIEAVVLAALVGAWECSPQEFCHVQKIVMDLVNIKVMQPALGPHFWVVESTGVRKGWRTWTWWGFFTVTVLAMGWGVVSACGHFLQVVEGVGVMFVSACWISLAFSLCISLVTVVWEVHGAFWRGETSSSSASCFKTWKFFGCSSNSLLRPGHSLTISLYGWCKGDRGGAGWRRVGRPAGFAGSFKQINNCSAFSTTYGGVRLVTICCMRWWARTSIQQPEQLSLKQGGNFYQWWLMVECTLEGPIWTHYYTRLHTGDLKTQQNSTTLQSFPIDIYRQWLTSFCLKAMYSQLTQLLFCNNQQAQTHWQAALRLTAVLLTHKTFTKEGQTYRHVQIADTACPNVFQYI